MVIRESSTLPCLDHSLLPARTERASRRQFWLVAGLLLLAAAAVYGPHVVQGGFTVDDYGHAVGVKHSRAGILHDYWLVTSHRPGLVLYIPLTHIILGPHPSLHLALAAILAVLVSLTLFALLCRLTVGWVHAALIAVLVLLFPWSDSAKFWAVAGHISLAVLLGIGGLLVALRGLDARAAGRPRAGLWLHAGAVTLYAASVLTYEIAGGVLLLAGALYATRAPWAVAWRRWIVDLAVVVPCLAWTALRSDRVRPSVTEMIDHAGAIADSGLTVLALATVPFGVSRHDAILAGGHPERDVILWALAAVAIAAMLVYRLLPIGDDARLELRRWLVVAGAGLAVVVAAWALYIPADQYYNPGAEGVGNRVNVMAGVGVVLIVYAVLALVATLVFRGLPRWPRLATVSCVVFATVLAGSYARDERDEQQAWARAATAADKVISTVTASIPAAPAGTTIYTFGHAGNERGGVSIFGASWDLKGAVQLKYDDPTLSAYPVLEGTTMSCSDLRLGPVGGGWSPDIHGALYGRAYFVNIRTGLAARIDTQAECAAALVDYPPGPVIRPQ
jgi:hypothetical protein